jgi:mannose-6-phosphate isomerase-like protein (cupin superfamily)
MLIFYKILLGELMEKISVINLAKEIPTGKVGWVTGLGKAPHPDPLLEIAFYNQVTGEANNPPHPHKLSTERLLVIKGGMTIEVEGKEYWVGPFQMISIPPGLNHHIVSYDKDTIALNLRNSPQGAVGHLPEDR